MCPICRSTWVKRWTMPYCGPGGTNYVSCTCNNCGYEWEETN